MKELLQAIQSALRTSATLSYVADADIFITADENQFPTSIDLPAIGIKDGDVALLIEEGQDWEKDYLVDLLVYQKLYQDDISLIGQDLPQVVGIFDICDDIHSVLYDNLLSISGMEIALPQSEGRVEWLIGGDLSLIRRKLTYRYQKLEVNP